MESSENINLYTYNILAMHRLAGTDHKRFSFQQYIITIWETKYIIALVIVLTAMFTNGDFLGKLYIARNLCLSENCAARLAGRSANDISPQYASLRLCQYSLLEVIDVSFHTSSVFAYAFSITSS